MLSSVLSDEEKSLLTRSAAIVVASLLEEKLCSVVLISRCWKNLAGWATSTGTLPLIAARAEGDEDDAEAAASV